MAGAGDSPGRMPTRSRTETGKLMEIGCGLPQSDSAPAVRQMLAGRSQEVCAFPPLR